MSISSSAGRISNAALSVIVFLLVIAALFAGFLGGSDWGSDLGNPEIRTRLENSAEKRRLIATLQANLMSSAAAEKSAVLADTDDTSKTFAEEAKRATAAVEDNRRVLGGLIESGGIPDQLERLAAFNECWVRYQEADREILELAGENTNLKALQLSVGPATEALERIQSALEQFLGNSGAVDVVRSAYRATNAALRIHSLESRHIAEASDAGMDAIEAQMKAFDAQAAEAFGALTAAADASILPNIDTARNAYAEFQKINSEVLSLSRRNSNLRSLTLSLGQKRKVTAECQDRLNGLQESLAQELSATR